uniref:prealbumin-like fold domain-containing protein n=1 Tax=uncultured Dubosiella sp. TaxID=1937011 RepID=UPI00259B5C7B
YSNHPYDENSFATTPEDKVLVLTYKLVGSKRDAKEENGEHKALEGAQFYLLNTKQENEANPIYAKVENGKFAGWTTKSNATILESKGENGGFEIQGLDAGTYYLKEIKAPVGYNIMEGLQSVEVIANKSRVYDFGEATSPVDFNTNSNDANGVKKTSIDQSGTMSVVVENGKGFTMPSTGAFGQTLIYGVGGLLALGGLGIRMARRRHEQD